MKIEKRMIGRGKLFFEANLSNQNPPLVVVKANKGKWSGQTEEKVKRFLGKKSK